MCAPKELPPPTKGHVYPEDPTSLQLLWQEFDQITWEALSSILGTPVSEVMWLQAKLPVSLVGLGVRAAEDHSSAAYCTSFLSSQSEAPATLPLAVLQLLSEKRGGCRPGIIGGSDPEDGKLES